MKAIVRACICLWAARAFALDPQRAITQLIHTAWTEQQGAPGEIRALAQTSDGYLWIGTISGLFRFDGVRFVEFKPRPGETLPSPRIRALLATRDGALWILFQSGALARLFDGHLKVYSDRDGLPATFVIVEQSDGTLLAGTSRGLFRFRQAGWKDAGEQLHFPPKSIDQVFLDKENTLWILSNSKVYFESSGDTSFSELEEPVKNVGGGGNFAEGPDGSIWFPEFTRSVHTVRRTNDHAPETEIRVGASCMLFDRDGSLWIATGGDGLRRLASLSGISGRSIGEFGPEAEQFTAAMGLSSDYVRAALEDMEGNLWFGTRYGLDRFHEAPFASVPIPHPDLPWGLTALRDGSVLTFTYSPAGILRLTPSGAPAVVPSGTATGIAEDQNGVPWIVVGGKKVYRLEQGKLELVRFEGDEDLKTLRGITVDHEGGIWLLDFDQGLVRVAQGKVTKVASSLNPAFPWGYLFTDRTGRVWFGRYDRVAVYEEGKSREFTPSEGVPPGPIFTIYEDRTGRIWVGGDGGLSRFDTNRFERISDSTGFPARSVFGMTEDAEGAWWLATDAGVLRIPPGELQRAAATPSYRVRYESFDLLDGLPGKPRKSFPMPVVVRDSSGRIWVATTHGIAYVNPTKIPRNRLPPPVRVEGVKIDGQEIDPVDGLKLSHNTSDLEIEYTALSLSIPQRVKFRYKLEGSDSGWHDAGTRRAAFYNRLPPKRYTFRVMACNDDGVWNEAGARWSFAVTPAFYQTAWFRIALVAAGLVILWLIYQRRVGEVTARLNLRYDERLAERTRIARDLHDSLLQNLAGISLQLDALSKQVASAPAKAGVLIGEVREQVDACFRDARIKVWNLRMPVLAEQGLGPALQEFLARIEPTTAARCEFYVSGEPRACSPQEENELLHIGEEAINNAIRHARPRSIRVALEYSRRALTLRISDDGVGFDPETRAKPGHWGLKNMAERAGQIRAKYKITSAGESGTEVEVRLPFFWRLRSPRVSKIDSRSDHR